MKLIYFFISLNLVFHLNGQRIQQERFPSQFSATNPWPISDGSFYVTPEFHATEPYSSTRNTNNSPFRLLHDIDTRIPNVNSNSFPMIMTSSINPKFEDNSNQYRDEKYKLSTPIPSFLLNNHKNDKGTKDFSKQDESIQRNIKDSIDRNDRSIISQTLHPVNQTILEHKVASEPVRGPDPDQTQAASFQTLHYVSTPSGFIVPTTAPAIPIVRLSNEMDLDGSFSYEALSADQTHYVQHSRMENIGTDKEEQIVEGSYSFVGDDGKTYTVHYIADSNGYRASGEHLPVPPPIPEIIQRSIQYNLAEEAQNLHKLKSGQESENKEKWKDSENILLTSASQRNLFTGRKPEAFSFEFSENSSSHIPVKTNYIHSLIEEKPKPKYAPIEPQITFLATQGAHAPSVNQFSTTNTNTFTNEKSPMPQLINYEAGVKEPEQDRKKALWPMQYDQSTNEDNQHLNKNSISRSFSENDEIILNFNDMTPEQYAKTIRNHFAQQSASSVSDRYKTNQFKEHSYDNNIQKSNLSNNHENNKVSKENYYSGSENLNNLFHLAEDDIISSHSDSFSKLKPNVNYNKHKNNQSTLSKENNKIISQEYFTKSITFTPPSQTITQSYDYENVSYETSILKSNSENDNYNNIFSNKLNTSLSPASDISLKLNIKDKIHDTTIPAVNQTQIPNTTIKKNFIEYKTKNNFIPILNPNKFEKQFNQQSKLEMSSTESNIIESIKDNIFLRHLLKPHNNDIKDDSKRNIQETFDSNYKIGHIPKHFQYEPHSYNEVNIIKSKPLDISDVLNYISNKNYFESNKLKFKNKPLINDNLYNVDQKNDGQINRDKNENNYRKPPSNDFISQNNREQEIPGIIKNYKILQRNNIKNSHLKNDNQFIPELPASQKFNIPPLGRAGPSMKSYLPPMYL